MWLMSILLLKIAPLWYHTITFVGNNEVVKTLNEIMVQVRLENQIFIWKDVFIMRCQYLVTRLRTGHPLHVDSALFPQEQAYLLKRHVESLHVIYNKVHSEARNELIARSLRVRDGNNLFQKAKGFYNGRQLSLINQSRDQLNSFMAVIRYTGAITLPENTELDLEALEALEALRNTGSSTDSGISSSSEVSVDICSPDMVDIVDRVIDIMLTVPGMVI
jgi:hypothetical protein